MLPDLHLHSCFSHDAKPHATINAICEQAIALAMPAVAITDHFDVNREFDTPPSRTLDRKGIFEAVKTARAKYGDRLHILLGIEAGQAFVYPQRAAAALAELPYDLILGSVHAIPDVPGFSHIDFDTVPDGLLREYFDRVLSLSEAICDLPGVNAIAHLTYFYRYLRRTGRTLDFADFHSHLQRLFQKMITRGIALEINTSTLESDGITLPHREIVELYRDCGGRLLTIGSDAHKPEAMAKGFAETAAMLRDCGFTQLAVPTAGGVLTFPIEGGNT